MRVRDALGISAKVISLVLLMDLILNLHYFGAYWILSTRDSLPSSLDFGPDQFIWLAGFLGLGSAAAWWFARWLVRNPCPPAFESELTSRTLLALTLAALGSSFTVLNLWSAFDMLKSHVDFEGHMMVRQPDFRVALLQLVLGVSVLMLGLIGWRGAILDRA